jgi:hypothetical protein
LRRLSLSQTSRHRGHSGRFHHAPTGADPVTIAIFLISCVVIFGVNWLGVFGDMRQVITVIAGVIGVISGW